MRPSGMPAYQPPAASGKLGPLPLPARQSHRGWFVPRPKSRPRAQGGRSAPPCNPPRDIGQRAIWGCRSLGRRVASRGCSFGPSPSGRSPPCSPVRRRGASSPSSGRACPATAGRSFPVGKPSAVAPVASGHGACQSSKHGRTWASIGRPSESYPPNRRRQNEGRTFGSGWWVNRAVACCRQWSACCRSRSNWV